MSQQSIINMLIERQNRPISRSELSKTYMNNRADPNPKTHENTMCDSLVKLAAITEETTQPDGTRLLRLKPGVYKEIVESRRKKSQQDEKKKLS